jgi:hypothetical protein
LTGSQLLARVVSHCSQAPASRPTAQLGKALLPLVCEAQLSPRQQVEQLEFVHPRHVPVAAQLRVEPQAWQVPPWPQDIPFIEVLHLPAELQQPAQPELESQTQVPFWQTSPAGHAGLAPQRQPTPPSPQKSAAGPHVVQATPDFLQWLRSVGKHWLPWQQPDGQEIASHVQLAPLQLTPGPQTGFAPHMHSPLAPHAFALLFPQITHAAALSRHR